MALLLGKQVLEVELGLDGTEHEVGVVEAQVLLVGVGGEGAATACPVLERGGADSRGASGVAIRLRRSGASR